MANFVYVIGAENGPQKIGKTNALKRRLDALQTASHETLMTAHAIEVPEGGAGRIERWAHHLLAAKSVRGEWFNVTPEEALEAIAAAKKHVESGEPDAPTRGRSRIKKGNSPTITFRLPVGLKARVYETCALREIAASDLVNEAISQWFENNR